MAVDQRSKIRIEQLQVRRVPDKGVESGPETRAVDCHGEVTGPAREQSADERHHVVERVDFRAQHYMVDQVEAGGECQHSEAP